MAGIYIHVPYCKQACHYCDFHFSTIQKSIPDYLEALRQEITLQQNYFNGDSIQTIYFGGGTPSLLKPEKIEDILFWLHNCFNVSKDSEITLEANPDDLNPIVLKRYLDIGINRLSIGIQSFNNDALKWMNRAHNAQQATQCLNDVIDAGFTNYSLDLIYGVPNVSLSQWETDLQTFFRFKPPHFSAYILTIEEKTKLAFDLKNHKFNEKSESSIYKEFELLQQFAELNGYNHYEISNFALSKFRSMHNSNYWKNHQYLGLGPSAHSFNGSVRKWNVSSNHKYINLIADHETYYEEEILSKSDRFNEFIMTRLRTTEGFNIQELLDEFDEVYVSHLKNEISKPVKKGLLNFDQSQLKLSKQAYLISDSIIADLFYIDESKN